MDAKMYIWFVELQEHFVMVEKDKWENDSVTYRVVAPDYESVLTLAKTVALDSSWPNPRDDVRLISIKQGFDVDAVAEGINQQ